MPRIFFQMEDNPRTIHLSGDKVHYLRSVLRCGVGDELEILDGKGNSYNSRITSITKRELTAEVLGSVRRETESPLNLILVQGLLKGEKMDLVIQKATELGVGEIIPAITERSQPRRTGKTDRWQKIAENASRQSGRTSVPVIHDLIPIKELFSVTSSYAPHFTNCKGLLFWEKEGIRLREAAMELEGCASLIIAVGSEGGFTESEVQAARARGFLAATLGNRILRAETAAIAAISITQMLIGDMG